MSNVEGLLEGFETRGLMLINRVVNRVFGIT